MSMSMSMIDRPRLLLCYCQISCPYTENQQMMFGTNMHLQCVRTGDLILGNTSAGRVRMQVVLGMGRNVLT